MNKFNLTSRFFICFTMLIGLINPVYGFEVAVGPKLSTQGIGLEARSPIGEGMFARLGVNYFSLNRAFDNASIKTTAKLNLLSIPVMLDYHPFDNSGFKLSAGIAYNGNHISATAKPAHTTILYGRSFTPENLGSIKTKVTLGNSVAPIVSIGYDNSFNNNSLWSFNCEVGAMYTGTPKLSVSANGNLEEAISYIERDAQRNFRLVKKHLKIFPILSLGIKYNM